MWSQYTGHTPSDGQGQILGDRLFSAYRAVDPRGRCAEPGNMCAVSTLPGIVHTTKSVIL